MDAQTKRLNQYRAGRNTQQSEVAPIVMILNFRGNEMKKLNMSTKKAIKYQIRNRFSHEAGFLYGVSTRKHKYSIQGINALSKKVRSIQRGVK